jgi:hypothetical protein
MPETFQAREPGDPIGFQFWLERSVNLTEDTTDMNTDGKSDDFIVPTKRANKAEASVAEFVEGRKSPKGSVTELSSMLRTPSRTTHPWERHGGHDMWQRHGAVIVRPNGGAV